VAQIAKQAQVGQTTPDWSSTTTYQAGDKVTFQGTVFQARQTNTGFAPTPPNSSPPDTDLALWDIPTPCGITPWLDETHYQVGSMVTFSGQTYTCTSDHVAVFNWTPTATPSLWRVATSSDSPISICQ
jgi:chitodextrinase